MGNLLQAACVQSPWERAYELASRQHRVIAVRQAAALGLPSRTLNRRAAKEDWDRPHRGVLVLPGAPATYARTAMVAYLAVRYGLTEEGHPQRDVILVGGRSAASVQGFTETRPTPVEIFRVGGCATTPRRGILVHRTITLTRKDRRSFQRIPVTAPARTIRDMAWLGAGVDELVEVAATAIQRGRLQLTELHAAAMTLGPLPGLATLVEVIDILQRDGLTDSPFERDIRAFVCSHGLVPHPGVFPLEVDGATIARLDIAYPPEQVFVESDGFGFHSLPSHLRSDHVRSNEIAARTEWKGVRVGKQEFRDNPERFLRQLTAALRSRGRGC